MVSSPASRESWVNRREFRRIGAKDGVPCHNLSKLPNLETRRALLSDRFSAMSHRIAFYTTAGLSAGHRQRIINIACSLRLLDPGVSMHLICPATYAGISWGPNHGLYTLVELPNLIPSGLSSDAVPTGSEELALQSEDLVRARCQRLQSALDGLSFDVLVVESFPFLTQRKLGFCSGSSVQVIVAYG